MPSCSKARNPRGYEITFDEESHSYTTVFRGALTKTGAVIRASGEFDQNDKTLAIFRYTSGTTFVNHFFPKFDADGKIAQRKASERGTTADQIRFEWKQKAANACAMGTRVHETCEDVLKGRKDLLGNWEFRNKPQDIHEKRLMAAGFTAATEILSKYTVLGVEQIVFDLDCQIAGTIDLLCQDKDGTVCIFDWKTNEKIDFKNRFGMHGLFPISHLDDCSAVHYGLQLSTYEFLLLRAEYFPHGTKFRRAIIHLTDNGPEWHDLPDYSKEVRDMALCMALEPPF